LFWLGAPHQVLEAARAGQVQLFTCGDLVGELEDVLRREKFYTRIHKAGLSVTDLLTGYVALARIVRVKAIAPVISEDPDDDIVLACAAAANAQWIISGDTHLLKLQNYQGITICSSEQALLQIAKLS
jgi:putative PIN family toxin of toxin-antitoxin system